MASQLTEQSAMHCIDCKKPHAPRSLDPSPFHSLLSQERMPTASETAAIRDFTRDTYAEIAWRELAIDRLLCEVAELRRRAEQHKSIIAPIRRIPPEIMAEIFLQLTQIEVRTQYYAPCSGFIDNEGGDLFDYTGYEPVLHKAPLIFGEVSRRWRAIALSTPRLWNSMFFVSTDTELRDIISVCDTWLKRSGSLPLSIRFYRAYSPDACQVIDQFQDLLRILLPYANRWRVLDLRIPSESYDVLYDGLPDSFPTLEALSVDYCMPAHSPSPSSSTPWARLRIAPKLRLLNFNDITGTGGEWHWKTFPWSQSTHIDVNGCSAYDCLQVLNGASTAVACRFVINHSSFLQHPSISHSTLQTLNIRAWNDIAPLWRCLICPLLSTLAIKIKNPDFRSPNNLPSFISRCDKTIENFTLDGCDIGSHQFMACLADMPRLRSLRIEESVPIFTDQVWESLTFRPNSSPLIPDLETLSFTGDPWGVGFGHRALLRMLGSRVRPSDIPAGFVPRLKQVDLVFFQKISESVCRRLDAFKQFGLKIFLDTLHEEEDESGSEASDEEEDESGTEASDKEETDEDA
ncbi:hypothetical protein K438DRAFT_161763 [Mycena galopus ATCC 62051]|nr:hypothetical protein K438DRAFT_161763 [Mycena galopus ATCC 62051]